jgi:tetratricopeptide (TPR) repeat protein
MTAFLLWLLLAQDLETLNERARVLASQGKPEEAAVLWRQMHKRSPAFFPAAFNLGYFYFSRKEYKEAEVYLRSAVKTQPSDFNARFLLGQSLAALDLRDDAIRQWRAALALQPKHAKLLGILAVEYGRGGYLLEAAGAAKRALELQPGDLNSHLLAIKACQQAQDPAGAALAETAAAKFPQFARAQFEHAWYLQRAGRTDAAMRQLERAISLDANYDEPHFFLGGILLDQGKLSEALPHLETAVKLRPDYTAASVALGRALMELERFEDAVAVLESAAGKAAQHPQPPLMLSRLYFRSGDLEKAHAAKALSLRLRRGNAALMETRQSRPFRP